MLEIAVSAAGLEEERRLVLNRDLDELG